MRQSIRYAFLFDPNIVLYPSLSPLPTALSPSPRRSPTHSSPHNYYSAAQRPHPIPSRQGIPKFALQLQNTSLYSPLAKTKKRYSNYEKSSFSFSLANIFLFTMPIRKIIVLLIIPPIFPVPVLKPPFPEMIIPIIIPNGVCITPKSNTFLRTCTFYIPSDKYSCPACSQMPGLSMELESNSAGDSCRGNLGRGRGDRGRARRQGKGAETGEGRG
jgi:hypothetical protein